MADFMEVDSDLDGDVTMHCLYYDIRHSQPC